MQAASLRIKAVPRLPPLKRRQFFEKYARVNGFDFLSPKAWYKQPYNKILATKGASAAIHTYKNNIPNALIDLFPEIGLEKSKFKSFKHHQFAKNRKRFFDNFAKSHNFDLLIPANWYPIQPSDIINAKGGSIILSYYGNSLATAIAKTYPAINIDKQKFVQKNSGDFTSGVKTTLGLGKSDLILKKWYSRKKRRIFFENYARAKGFDYLSPKAWYSQTYFSVTSYKEAAEVLKYYKNDISEALVDLFPEIKLEKLKFKSILMQTSSLKPDTINQGVMAQVVQDLFLSEHVIINSRKKSQVENPDTGNFFEIDVWVPNLKLGFEFQDIYHYVGAWYSHSTLDSVQQLDASKRHKIKLTGTTLVQVPCWWDGAPESLAATIQSERPDLLAAVENLTDPIPLNPLPTYFKEEEVPAIGSLMLASFPLDSNFTESIDSRTWWMGEKYDGMRCCWIPEHRKVYSRTGKKIPLPFSFIALLPNISVDGEFWFGRGLFPLIYSLLHGNSLWHELKMLSFDYPGTALSDMPFEVRYDLIINVIPENHPTNILAPRILCEGSLHLESLLGKVMDYGGEGIILRKVASLYEPGRNKSLIKLKTSYGDAEGQVVTVDSEAILLKLPNGEILQVPMQHVHILSPPLQVGEIVTFSYEKVAKNESLLAHVEILRRRNELKWEDISLNSHSLSEETNFTSKKRGVWNFDTMKEYMTNLAKSQNLDPLLPSTWHKIPFKLIFQTKGGRTILNKFKDSLTALTSLFPNIGLQNYGKFNKNLSSPLVRRHFFENYAKSHSFPALSPSSWYETSQYRMAAEARSAGVLEYHGNSLANALTDLFPEIGLEKSKFKTYKWANKSDRRMFFEDYARENNFNFLSADAWYSQPVSKVTRSLISKGALRILLYHRSVVSALIDMFPELNLEKSRFKT